MDHSRATAAAGFTLIEIVIAVAVVAASVATGVGVTLASRSFAVAAAATEFDHVLDSARTVARELQGATLVFTADAFGDGTEVRVLTPGPNGTLTPTTLPVLHTRAAIEEVESLGKPPFAFVVHGTGALGGRPGYRLGSAGPAEVGCPASGSFHFVVRAAGAAADRFVPCRITLAASGPVAFATLPPVPVGPSPTPCAGACKPPALPTPPSSTPSCPPGYSAIPGGCAPASVVPGSPRYHVAASLASQAVAVGGTGTFTAQATLTNANAVPAGTPASLPVQQSADRFCTASPAGAQPSGTTFTVSGVTAGTCTIAIQADTSAVAGATADTASLALTVTGSAGPTPTPSACDLISNGKCYHRIVGPTSQTFQKMVSPVTQCSVFDGVTSCRYLDTIDHIWLSGFDLSPVVPPVPDYELLVKIQKIGGLTYGCAPYSFFQAVPGEDLIVWPSVSIGTPNETPSGFGDPSTYVTRNYVQVGLPQGSSFDDTLASSTGGASLNDLINALSFRSAGREFSFTYSPTGATQGATLTWFPDVPGCDSADPLRRGTDYGLVTVQIVFEIYQSVW